MHLTAGLFSSEADLCCSIHRGHSTLGWGRVCHVRTYVSHTACWIGPVCYPGQANRFCAHADWLSPSLEAGLAYGVYVGHRKRKRTLSNTLEILRNSLRCSQTLKRIYLSRHNDTAQRSGFLSGVVGWDFRKRHKPKKKNQSTNSGRSGLGLFFSCSESLSFSYPFHNIQSWTEAAVWQTHVRLTPVYQKGLKKANISWKCAETDVRWHLDSISLLAGLACVSEYQQCWVSTAGWIFY